MSEGARDRRRCSGLTSAVAPGGVRSGPANLRRSDKLDTEDPEPLMEFYRAFVRQGLPVTDNAVAALHYASDLAPQDVGVEDELGARLP
jgi:hypothetical protein